MQSTCGGPIRYLGTRGQVKVKTSGKRVLFRLEQKQIRIAFYNRQAAAGISAEPRDVVAEKQRRGLIPVTETQIKSWWSSHH